VSTRDERTTLATIALAAGVSVATVSKVVNSRPDVAPTTRALVQNLLDEHAYVRRRADAEHSPSVELLFHGRLTAYSLEILWGVVDAAAEVAIDVVVARRPRGSRRSNGTRSAYWVRQVTTAGRLAVIAVANELAAEELTALSRAHVPIVVIDPLNLPRARVISVGSTNFTGGFTATQHLLGLGHRRIAYVGGPAAAACNQARVHGYRGAMEGAGIRISKGYVRIGQFRYEDGMVEGAALLALPQPPTAIFAGNDETALGVLEAARTLGLRVPDELSVVGFDDTESARVASPPLTTVAQPLRRMGAVALRTGLRLAAGERLDSHHVELATELIVRGSTAPPLPEPRATSPGNGRRKTVSSSASR
jgi:LacI family transcriptional regulator